MFGTDSVRAAVTDHCLYGFNDNVEEWFIAVIRTPVVQRYPEGDWHELAPAVQFCSTRLRNLSVLPREDVGRISSKQGTGRAVTQRQAR
jgi:hypothetical protein